MAVLSKVTCHVCGLHYGIDEEVVTLWQRDQHDFVCPNGHSTRFIVEPTPEQKELAALRIEVKELREKLSDSGAKREALMNKVVQLEEELEIWHPVAKD